MDPPEPDGTGDVNLTIWGVRGRTVPLTLTRMAVTLLRVRHRPGLRFAKLLGTGSGRSFTPRDADLGHWALLTVWDDAARAEAFAATGNRWDDAATERLDVRLRSLSSRGRWSRREPFTPTGRAAAGPVASITRARLRPARALSFWRAVPPVSADLRRVDGLRLAVGIGELPVGLQGTFSIWDSAQALNDFAYRRTPHADAVARTAPARWYAEELFARFAVVEVRGTYRGRPVSGAAVEPDLE